MWFWLLWQKKKRMNKHTMINFHDLFFSHVYVFVLSNVAKQVKVDCSLFQFKGNASVGCLSISISQMFVYIKEGSFRSFLWVFVYIYISMFENTYIRGKKNNEEEIM